MRGTLMPYRLRWTGQRHSTSVNCCNSVRWIGEKLSSEMSVSTAGDGRNDNYECNRRREVLFAGGAVWVSLNSSASFSVIAPPSSSASTIVTARR